MSGASLPTDTIANYHLIQEVLIPDEWGKSSDEIAISSPWNVEVLIPDEWGKSSDREAADASHVREVLIPDEWGKSSDNTP